MFLNQFRGILERYFSLFRPVCRCIHAPCRTGMGTGTETGTGWGIWRVRKEKWGEVMAVKDGGGEEW